MSSSSSPPLAPISSPIMRTTTTTTSTATTANLAPDNNAGRGNEPGETTSEQHPQYSTSQIELNGGAGCCQAATTADNNCSLGNAMQTSAKSTPLVRANMMTIMMEAPSANANSDNNNNNHYHHQQQHCHQMPFIYQTNPGQQQQQQQKQLQVKAQHQNQLQASSASPSPSHQQATSSVSPASVTNPDTRTHVVGELYDTERSYVESLQILTEKYMKPLKSLDGNKNLIDSNLVDEIFYTIPEILQHHETFLGALQDRLSSDWDSSQVIGNVFIEAFTNQQIIDIYTAFINNWKNARQAIKVAIQAKPAFERFLEAMSREHRNKLTLDALLIMPVQRIPRYELLIKELIKHTPLNHQDHGPLIEAQKKIHELALKIDRAEREMIHQEQLRDLESLIEGHVELHHPQRDFIRYDLVTISASTLTVAKKERVLFLFCDLLIMTSVKKKVSRRSNLQAAFSNSSNDISLLEGNKFKLLLRVSLDQIEIKHDSEQQAQLLQQQQQQLQQQQQQQQQHQLQLLTQQKQAIQDLRRELETDLFILQQMKALNEKTSNADNRARLDGLLDDMTNQLRYNLTNIEQQELGGGCDITQAQFDRLQQSNQLASPTSVVSMHEMSPGAAKDLCVIQSSNNHNHNPIAAALRVQDNACSSPTVTLLSTPNSSNEFPASSSSLNILATQSGSQQQSEAATNTSLEFMILNSNSLQPQQTISSRDSSANSNIIPMTSGSEVTSNNSNLFPSDNQLATTQQQHETLVVTFTSVDRRQAFLQAFLEAKQQRFNLQQQQRQQHQRQQQQKMFSSSVTLRLSQSDSSPTHRGGDRRTRLQHQDEVVELNNNNTNSTPSSSRFDTKRPMAHQHSQTLYSNGGTIVHQMSAPQALNEASGNLSDLNNGYLHGEARAANGAKSAPQAAHQSRGRDCSPCLASSSSNTIGMDESDRGLNFPLHGHHHRHHHHQLMHQPASHPALLSTFCCNEQHNSNNEKHPVDQNNNSQASKQLQQHSDSDRLCNLDENSSDMIDSSSTGSGYLTMLGCDNQLRQQQQQHQQKASSVIALASDKFEKSNLNDEQRLCQVDSVYQSLRFTPKFLLSLPAMNFLNTQHPTLQFTCSTTREKFTVISEFKCNQVDNIVTKRQTVRDVSGQLWLCMSNGYVSHVALISLVKKQQQQQQLHMASHESTANLSGNNHNNNELCYTTATSIMPIIHSAGDICKSHINCATQVRWARKSRPSVIQTSDIMAKKFSNIGPSDTNSAERKLDTTTGQQDIDVASNSNNDRERRATNEREEEEQAKGLRVEVAIQSSSPPVDIKTSVARTATEANETKHCLSESAPTSTITNRLANVERQNSTSSSASTSYSLRRPANQRAQTPPCSATGDKTSQICRRQHHNSYDYLRNNQHLHHRKRPLGPCNHKNRLIGKPNTDNQTANYNMFRGQHCHPSHQGYNHPTAPHNHHPQQQHHHHPMQHHNHHPHHHHHHHHNHLHHHHSHHHGHWGHHHHHNHHHMYDSRHHTVPLAELRRALERQTRILDDSQPDAQRQLASRSLMPPINLPQATEKPDSLTELNNNTDADSNASNSQLVREQKARSTTPPARFNSTGQRSLRSARMLRHQASLKTSAILAKLVSGASRKSSAYLKNKLNQQQQQQQEGQTAAKTSETEPDVGEQGTGEDKQQQQQDSISIESNNNNAPTCQLTVPRMTKTRLPNLHFNSSSSNLHTPIVSPLSSVSSLNSTNSSLTVNSACGSSLNRSNCSILNTGQQQWSSTTCCALIGNHSSGAELNHSSGKNINSLGAPRQRDYSDSQNYHEDTDTCGAMRGRSATVPCRAFCLQSSTSMDLECNPCPLNDMVQQQTSTIVDQMELEINNNNNSYKVSKIVRDDEDPDRVSHLQEQQQQQSDDQHENSSSLWLGCDNGTLIIIDCLSGNNDNYNNSDGQAPSGACGFCNEQEAASQQQKRNLTCRNVHAEIELGSSICDIRVYKDKMVFVALANGQLVIFSRQETAEDNKWSLSEPQTLNLATPTSEQQLRSTATTTSTTTSKLCLINDEYLWYSHGKSIYVLQIETLKLETIIVTPTSTPSASSSAPATAATTSIQPSISIDQMEFVANLNGVWLSFQNCPLIQFYDVTSYKLIIEISLLEPINKILSYGNEIIRQHKTACLRATSLLDIYNQADECNSLFIGTSAGIIIYLTIKRSQLDEFLKADRQSASSEIVWNPQVVSLRHGHSGQVKFLHLIELMEHQAVSRTTSGEPQPARQTGKDTEQRSELAIETTTSDQSNNFSQSNAKTLCLISGGSGVDFYGPSDELQSQLRAQHSNNDEDCMNHLMLWQLCSK